MYFDRHPPDGMKERAYALFEAAEGPFTLRTEGHFRACLVIFDGINSGTSHAIFTVLTNLLADDPNTRPRRAMSPYFERGSKSQCKMDA
jgi:hypothetical protein